MIRILLFILILLTGKVLAQSTCSSAFSITASGSCFGSPTTLSVTGPSGLNFSATWDFGDGSTGTGTSTSHTYSGSSFSTVFITAEATIQVVQAASGYPVGYTCNVSQSSPHYVCIIIDPLPVVTEPPGNPFLEGKKGNWKIKRTHILQTERKQTRSGTTDNVNLRTDGTYRTFPAFWEPGTGTDGTWKKINSGLWTFKTQINHYNPFGSFELENVDPLNRYSAALYGYNYTMPTGVAVNARYREIAFDSFEDYNYDKCSNNHFSFQFVDGIEEKISETTSHSGRRSIRLAAGAQVIMVKPFAPCAEDDIPQIIFSPPVIK